MSIPPPRPPEPAVKQLVRVELLLKDGRYLIAYSRAPQRKPDA